jgi:Flp pilus assembly protein TadG
MIKQGVRQRDRKAQSGSVMLEFALSALLLTSVFTGTFQFGYTLYVYNKLESAVVAGTRYASRLDLANDNNSNVPAAFSDAVKNMTVYGTPTPGDSPTAVAPGLTPANVSVGVTFTGGVGNEPVNVTVSIVNYQVNAVFRTFSFNNKPSLTMSYDGQYCSLGAACL